MAIPQRRVSFSRRRSKGNEEGKGFEEEHEVRLVYQPCYRNLLANLNCETPKGHDHDDIEFRVRDGSILSYFTYQLPKESIHSVILGPKCTVDFAQLTLFLNRYAPHVRINNEIHHSKRFKTYDY